MDIPIFIIHLNKDTDKLVSITKEMSRHGLKACLFNAINGSKISSRHASQQWYDPYTHRSLTYGELGCAMSHYKVWRKIIDENYEKVIILEDDVEILDDNLISKIADINANLFDIIYLGRKKITKQYENKVPIADDLVKASYSYWTCGYLISLSGAHKLASLEFYNNVIPVDEYLPIMYQANTISYISHNYTPGNNNNPVRCYAFQPPLLKPKENAFLTSSTFFSLPIVQERDDLLVITVATEHNDAVKRYLSSCHLFGYHPVILGLGTDWKGGNMALGPGGGYKINLLKQYLDKLDSNRLILFTDCYDVIANDNINILIKKYTEKFSPNTVFATEVSCWPDINLADKYPAPCQSGVRSKYLNSGLFIGHSDQIKLMINNDIKNRDDDQLAYTKYFLEHVDKVSLDYQQDLFLCLNGVTSKVKTDNRKGCILLNKQRPAFIHGNGPINIKLTLNRLANYCGQGYNEIYGYQSMVNTASSLPNILVIIQETILLDYKFINGLKHQDYPLDKLTFLFISKLSSNDDISSYENRYNFKFHYIYQYRPEVWNQIIGFIETIAVTSIFFLTTNAILTSMDCLKTLVGENRSVIGPLLKNPSSLFSNFWGDLDKNGYYKRSPDYLDIINSRKCGCWNVPYLWYCILFKKEYFTSKFLNYQDSHHNNIDMIFCASLRNHNIFMHLLNTKLYGYFLENNTGSLTSYQDDLINWENLYLDQIFLDNLRSNSVNTFTHLGENVLKLKIFSELFCQQIIHICELSEKWSQGGRTYYDQRIQNKELYPTRDIHLKQINLEDMWKFIVKKYITPLVYQQFFYTTKDINLAFVVKYDLGGQKKLNPHHDSSTYTVNICLNKDFKGGGCRFIRQNLTIINQEIGSLIIHPGRLTHYHEALEITEGTRYILVSFIN